MSELIIEYPVFANDGKELLPAQTVLSDENLKKMISGNQSPIRTSRLLDFGSMKSDILVFLDQDNYLAVFDNKATRLRLMARMMKAELPLPVLESIYFFKEYDFYTYRHLLMVFALSTLLAEYLVKDRVSIMDGVIGAPSHDIGKIAVPLDILNKPTPLTSDELKILRHHTLSGYVLLCHYFRDPANITARVARDHHERRDGSGYPRRIKIDDMMIELVIVTDIYDALISSRPYRPSSYEKRTALEEITKMAEKGLVSWNVVKALINQNRNKRVHIDECLVSLEKRGVPPPNNLYGRTPDKNTGKTKK
ncbi:MAG: HD domain-containing protein [Smithellaceae bacterium]|nr:HD domain-containing protein [Smithellaceae bacterium]